MYLNMYGGFSLPATGDRLIATYDVFECYQVRFLLRSCRGLIATYDVFESKLEVDWHEWNYD